MLARIHVGRPLRLAWIVPVLLLGSGFAESVEPPAKQRPNIVLLLVDDLGWRDAGFAGSDFYETPNIDTLARDGITFWDAYACAANCAPSRACILSGQYPVRHGIYSVFPLDQGPRQRMRLRAAPNRRVLSGETVTVAEALAGAGYVTAMFGKWNVGLGGATRPEAQGFGVARPSKRPRPEDFARTGDAGDARAITEQATHFIEEHRDRPFFALVSHHAVHIPHHARASLLEKYASKPAGELHANLALAAMLEELDESIGVLLGKLDELGLADRTLVVLTSDNGGLPQSPQTPLRGTKGSYYEGGIRVPLLARWPGVITPGSTSAVPVDNVDLFPTFLQAARVRRDDGLDLDGVSLVPLFENPAHDPERSLFWHFPGYLFGRNAGARDPTFQTRPVTVVRNGPWKLHLYHEEWALDGGRESMDSNGAIELYDLGRDPGERKNLAREEPERRDALLAEMLEWVKATGAPVPTEPNPEWRGRKKRRQSSRPSSPSNARSPSGPRTRRATNPASSAPSTLS